MTNSLLITGAYGNDPTHGQGLGDWIKKEWKRAYNLDIATSVYDRDVLSLIPAAGPVPTLIGFSFGGFAAVQVATALTARGQAIPRLILIDPVPFPNPKPNYAGADLPDGVKSAYCVWRGYNNQHNIFSGPIRSAKCPFTSVKYNPVPSNPFDEAYEHGQYCRVPAARLVVDWVRLP